MYVKVNNGAVEIYPYSIGQLRKDNPQVSFPKKPTDELLAMWGVYPVEPVAPPLVDMTKTVREGQPVNSGGWKQTWLVEAATATEIAARKEGVKNEIVDRTQARLDEFAQTRSYDGILSLCTYATSTNAKFQAEGQYGVEARDATWAKLYEILAEVEAGTRPIPSGYSDIEPELPALQWPV